MKTTQNSWIEEGYRTFAHEGPLGLKVERLARGTSTNKSSFYHHFADLEVFTAFLIAHHLKQAHSMAEKEARASTLDELVEIIMEHKIDLLFNRQLRIHRDNPDFQACFQKTNEITGQAMAGIWAEVLDLKDHSYLAGLVLRLSLENFFLQITDETLDREWLYNYFETLRTLIREFKKTGEVRALDGSV